MSDSTIALAETMAAAARRAFDTTREARDAADELGDTRRGRIAAEAESVAEKLRAAFGELEDAADEAEGLRALLAGR